MQTSLPELESYDISDDQEKQALRSKFLVTAKGWYWQTLKEIGCQTLFCESGCQVTKNLLRSACFMLAYVRTQTELNMVIIVEALDDIVERTILGDL